MVDFASTYDPGLAGTVQFGDIIMRQGDIMLTADAQEGGTHPVLQDVLQRLRTFRGEFFLNIEIGVPWYQEIIGNTGANSSADAVIQNAILATPGVQLLTAYSATFDSARRVMSVSFTATTVSGQVSYSGSISPQSEGTSA